MKTTVFTALASAVACALLNVTHAADLDQRLPTPPGIEPPANQGEIDPLAKVAITKLRRISRACENYARAHGEFPGSLADLVKSGELKTQDLFIVRSDGGIASPVYYPGFTMESDPRNVFLTFRLNQLRKELIGHLDGSVMFREIEQPNNPK